MGDWNEYSICMAKITLGFLVDMQYVADVEVLVEDAEWSTSTFVCRVD